MRVITGTVLAVTSAYHGTPFTCVGPQYEYDANKAGSDVGWRKKSSKRLRRIGGVGTGTGPLSQVFSAI